ncbi:MAG TPA: hypothetical protein VHA30_04320 [Patescibacteria group bacterium]|nr:hypothetical protein [Patescibacteria group bacterium]
MDRTDPLVFANYLRSLPQKVKTLREQVAVLTAEADSAEAMLENLDRVRLDSLKLTGDPNVDFALRLSMESGSYGGKYWLEKFLVILEKIERMEKEVADWEEGGLMLTDLTSQVSCPLSLQFVVLEVPAKPTLQIVPTCGYFHDIPISVRIPARLLMAWNSNEWVMKMGRFTNITSAQYEVASDGLRLGMIDAEHRAESPITSTFDLTQLLHPNWGTWRVHLAGIVLGEQTITEHIEKWRLFVKQGYCMGPSEIKAYLGFLDEFLGAIRRLYQVVA